MRRSQRRLLLLILALPFLVVVSALLYMTGMALLEGQQRTFWQSVEWAAETLTTTGYGADSRWNHPAMILFVLVVQFTGVFLVILIFPIYLIPFLEERFETRLPQEAPAGLSGHVAIYRYGPAVETLIAELAAAQVPVLVLEPDDTLARRLFEQKVPVVHRALGDGVMRAARLEAARAVVANGTDDENAAMILTARQRGYQGPILALVEEPYHRKPMTLAGATATFTPRHILGAALAARASQRISPRVAGIQSLGRSLEVAEVRVGPGSPLAGRTLEEAAVASRTGATLIGQWVGGELEVLSGSDTRIERGSTLVAVGSHDSIDRLSGLAEGDAASHRKGHFVVGGGGEVGRKVAELLRAVDEEVVLIDRQAGDGVDLAGDVLDMKVLEEAKAREAQGVILALNTDSSTLFATVILKDVAPDVPVIARVNRAENVERIHRAGAYFALSISQVSGQMLAKKLLGQDALLIDPQLKVLKLPAAGLAGHHPADLRIRERTGCSVVAVERGDQVLADLGPDLRFRPDDTIYVCGSDSAVRRFTETFPSQ